MLVLFGTVEGVTDSRYVPRNLSDQPAGFGHGESLIWKTSDVTVELTRIEAAKIQHFYSLRIRKRMVDKPMSAKQFASESGIRYDRLMKVLRGEMIMRLEDIGAADLVLGEVSELAVEIANRRRKVQADPTLTARAASSRGLGIAPPRVRG